MIVSELIDKLKTLDPNALVVIAKDAEGSDYSPSEDDAYPCRYEAENTWSGRIGFASLTPELIQQGYNEDDIVYGVSAVALYPIN